MRYTICPVRVAQSYATVHNACTPMLLSSSAKCKEGSPEDIARVWYLALRRLMH